MAKTMQAVMLTRAGGPEVLEVVDVPLPEPGPGEVRVRVLVTGVGSTDVTMRRGYYPYAPAKPFIPGYESVGVVDALGEGVTSLTIGQKVCALLVHGGYATHVVRGADHWHPVPDGLDDAEVAGLILNYVTAWQAMHRVADVRAGQTTLVTAAAGGVGQALLDLHRAEGISAIGAAGAAKHDIVRAYGAEPIEGRTAPLDLGVHAIRPTGVDAAFDGVGGEQLRESIRATREGGRVVWYGFMAATGLMTVARNYFDIYVGTQLGGRSGAFYGITALYQKDKAPFREDLARLLLLLGEGKIRPTISLRLPLLAAREANERIEKGGINGKIVLMAEPGV